VTTDPNSILVYLLVLIAAIYWLQGRPGLAPWFRYLPPVIWVYFLPMISTTLGIIPADSPLYTWVKIHLLPPALILLLLSANLPALVRLGPKALGTMLCGTLGIIIGGPVALALLGRWLPADAWQGMGALSGSWIGGSSNMVAIGASLGTRDDLFGVMIIVDTVVGYGWMGVVIFLSGFQEVLDRWNGVDTSALATLNRNLDRSQSNREKPLNFPDLILMVAVGMFGGMVALKIGAWLPEVGKIITSFGWTIIIVTLMGILMSLTPLARLESSGASHVGNLFLYLLLATIGAGADFRLIVEAPLFLLVGVIWILVHATILFLGGRLLKAPMFLIATSSQANIGGVVRVPRSWRRCTRNPWHRWASCWGCSGM
jgi:uncharacterized membrane protein